MMNEQRRLPGTHQLTGFLRSIDAPSRFDRRAPYPTTPHPQESMRGMPAFLTLVVGANRGIGLELCKQLHKRGDQVRSSKSTRECEAPLT